MKKLAAMLVMAILVMPAVATAGSLDNFADTITGRNDEVPMEFTLEIVKEIQTEAIPGLNLIPMIKEGRVQIGISGSTPMGEEYWETGRGQLISRIIF